MIGGKGYYFGDVMDGICCEGNKNVFDVCIEGKCVVSILLVD